jgi:hypothetical protein
MEQVKFYGIDSWNRSIFKSTTSKKFYGCTEKLFRGDEDETHVLSIIKSTDLTYFGTSFDCEPWGKPEQVEIINSKGESK